MKTIASLFVLASLLAACSSTSDDTPAAAPLGDGGGADTSTPVADGAAPVDGATPTDGGTTPTCTAAEATLLKPVASVSTGEVTLLAEASGIKTLYVDASAGGAAGAATNPRVYLDLAAAARVEVSDIAAKTSTAWDLSIERPILFTNGGDGGAGQGGAIFLADKAIEAVTAADATGKTFAPESFFDADCVAKVDMTGAVKTSFDGWYDYDQATNHLTPKNGTWLVKGGSGTVFKVQLLSYYATSDGGVGEAGGRYTLKVGAL